MRELNMNLELYEKSVNEVKNPYWLNSGHPGVYTAAVSLLHTTKLRNSMKTNWWLAKSM